VFEVKIVEYDETMIESYVSFNVDLFDKVRTQNQMEYALNDSINIINYYVGNLNGILVNIITPLNRINLF
jgi:hypothetical protein